MDAVSAAEEARRFFDRGLTLDVGNRLHRLEALQAALEKHEQDLLQALHEDLGKSPAEAYMTELALVYGEIREVRHHLRAWARTERVRTPLAAFPDRGAVYREPYGLVLILAPWNYPLNLSLVPLVDAVAAGNVCLVKCSGRSPHTARALDAVLQEAFPAGWARVLDESLSHDQVLAPHYDFVFFTGGMRAGRQVYARAAQELTPVVLELGGKSPVIVDETADLKLAARRIAWGKWTNAGQTCIAPDYVLVQRKVRDRFLALLEKEIRRRYANAEDRDDWPHMIDRRAYDRLTALIDAESGVIGGRRRSETLRIAPTLAPRAQWTSPCMQEEIFGPLLPVLVYDDLDRTLAHLRSLPRPLAVYVFTSRRRTAGHIIRTLPFGGGCVNDVLMHLSTARLPFGGVGASGIGAYHGRAGYETFSHRKSIMQAPPVLDMPLRYPPYGPGRLGLLKRFM